MAHKFAHARSLRGSLKPGVVFTKTSEYLNQPEDVGEVVSALIQNPSIRSISMNECSLSSLAASCIGTALRGCKQFEELRLTDMFFQRSMAEIGLSLDYIFAGIVASQCSLTIVDLSNNLLSIGIVGSLSDVFASDTCRSLRELHINNCGINAGGAKLLGAAFQKSIRRSKVSGTRPLALRVFAANINSIENTGARYLARFFAKLCSLVTVSLVACNIRGGGIVALANSLKLNRNLMSIDLHDNLMNCRAAIALGRSLSSVRRLKSLNIGACKLSSAALIAFAKHYANRRVRIETIDLSYNEIGCDAAVVLMETVITKRELRSINLVGNVGIGKGGQEILENLTKMHNLRFNKNTGGGGGPPIRQQHKAPRAGATLKRKSRRRPVHRSRADVEAVGAGSGDIRSPARRDDDIPNNADDIFDDRFKRVYGVESDTKKIVRIPNAVYFELERIDRLLEPGAAAACRVIHKKKNVTYNAFEHMKIIKRSATMKLSKVEAFNAEIFENVKSKIAISDAADMRIKIFENVMFEITISNIAVREMFEFANYEIEAIDSDDDDETVAIDESSFDSESLVEIVEDASDFEIQSITTSIESARTDSNKSFSIYSDGTEVSSSSSTCSSYSSSSTLLSIGSRIDLSDCSRSTSNTGSCRDEHSSSYTGDASNRSKSSVASSVVFWCPVPKKPKSKEDIKWEEIVKAVSILPQIRFQSPPPGLIDGLSDSSSSSDPSYNLVARVKAWSRRKQAFCPSPSSDTSSREDSSTNEENETKKEKIFKVNMERQSRCACQNLNHRLSYDTYPSRNVINIHYDRMTQCGVVMSMMQPILEVTEPSTDDSSDSSISTYEDEDSVEVEVEESDDDSHERGAIE